jgi:hypothetical protein
MVWDILFHSVHNLWITSAANANLEFHNHHSTTLATWFLDTGANQHVTHDFINMTNSEPYPGIG